MQSRYLGNSGLRVSEIGLGCGNFGWVTDAERSAAIVHRALEVGITLFDTSDYYGEGASEEFLGAALKGCRHDIAIATKFGMTRAGATFSLPDSGDASRRAIKRSVEASLRRLGTDYIDLYQIHWPDKYTPIEETLRALDDLVGQGKIMYIGCSNMPVWRMVDAVWVSRQHSLNRFISSQDEYNLLVRDPDGERIPAMQALGLGLLPYFPLANGMLTGKYSRGRGYAPDSRFAILPAMADRTVNDRNWAIVESLAKFCGVHGHTLLELAFSWLLARPAVASVIAGASRPEQINGNVAAAGWSLTALDLAEIDRITTST